MRGFLGRRESTNFRTFGCRKLNVSELKGSGSAQLSIAAALRTMFFAVLPYRLTAFKGFI
jgi:hypothetical protein